MIGCFVTLGALSAQPGEEPDTVVFAGKGTAHLLCADPRGELTCYDKAFAWQLPHTMPGSPADYCLRAQAAVGRVSSGKAGRPDAGLGGDPPHRPAVCGAGQPRRAGGHPGRGVPRPGGRPPRSICTMPRRGERIFDIAKRYHARARDLAAANHLEPDADTPVQEMTTGDACLLIPAAL